MENNTLDLKIAILIDSENVNPDDIKIIFDEIKSKGTITIKRAFGSANKLNEDSWKKVCLEEAITMCPQYNYTKGKNASDFNLVINAMDFLYQKEVDMFVIISSDSDFTGLVTRLREENKYVIGVGEKKSNKLSINAYNEFIYIEALKGEIKESNYEKETIRSLIVSILESTDNKQMLSSQLNEALRRQNSDFSYKNYGFRNFTDFLKNVDGISVSLLEDKTTYLVKLNKTIQLKNEKVVLPIKDQVLDYIYRKCKMEKQDLGILTQEITKKFKEFKLSDYKCKKLKKFIEKNAKGIYKIDKAEISLIK